MAEYIEGEAICKDCIHYDVCYHIEHYGRELETDKPCEQFKSADVVEVVRCKDCVFWDISKKGFGQECACKLHSIDELFTKYKVPDDFCSEGERRSK